MANRTVRLADDGRAAARSRATRKASPGSALSRAGETAVVASRDLDVILGRHGKPSTVPAGRPAARAASQAAASAGASRFTVMTPSAPG